MMMPGVGSLTAGPQRLDASSSQLDKAGASIPPRRSVFRRGNMRFGPKAQASAQPLR